MYNFPKILIRLNIISLIYQDAHDVKNERLYNVIQRIKRTFR